MSFLSKKIVKEKRRKKNIKKKKSDYYALCVLHAQHELSNIYFYTRF